MAKKYTFKQAALLAKGKAVKGQPSNKNSLGVTYSVGVHEVPEEHLNDATFKHFLKHKLIEPYEAQEQGELAPASSPMAKVSAESAKSQLQPDSEIGGESQDDSKKGKNKKG